MRKFMTLLMFPMLMVSAVPAAMASITAPVTGKTIAIDPGHGGKDPGAINKNHKLTEKEMNMAVSNRLKRKLEAAGAKVAMTRTGDETLSLHQRVIRANSTGAAVLLSVHHNGAAASVNGTESYYSQANDQKVASSMQRRLVEAFRIPDRGVKQMQDFALTRLPSMPSTITEASFVQNNTEARKWTQGIRAQQEADALYEGLNDYFSS